jgi:hypothetical protein
VLDEGALPLDLLERRIDDWIQEQARASTTPCAGSPGDVARQTGEAPCSAPREPGGEGR